MKTFLLVSFALVFGFTLVTSEEGVELINSRVTNAPRATLGQFPWHVSLTVQYRNDNTNRRTYCGGAILNELWILTNAECVSNARTIQADVGSVLFSRPGLTVFPEVYILHPQYNPNRFVNNVALLRLPFLRPFNFPTGPNPSFRPIRLPSLSQQNFTFENEDAYFSGFGYTAFNSLNISENLLYSHQRVVSNVVCRGYYDNDAALISPNVLCAQGYDLRQSPCNGDGGSALAVNEFGQWTLVGLSSFLHSRGSCGRQPTPAAFTRITSHLQWISRTAGYNLRP